MLPLSLRIALQKGVNLGASGCPSSLTLFFLSLHQSLPDEVHEYVLCASCDRDAPNAARKLMNEKVKLPYRALYKVHGTF